MGLDMYLVGRKYLWPTWDECGNMTGIRHELAMKLPELANHPDRTQEYSTEGSVASVESILLYWRKANHIHKWFVDNIQKGKDDCKKYLVSAEDLNKLFVLCRKTLETKSEENLPTQGGLFFGPTDYGDYYWQMIEHTISRLEYILGKDENGQDRFRGWVFEYSSSW